MDLVERSELMGRLEALLAESRAGAGTIVLLGGEAGAGKTSLARAFVERSASSHRVLWGSCEPLVTPDALAPFHDMGPFAAVLAAPSGRVELRRALLDDLVTTPTVMVIEDAHWSDDATLDSLRFIGRRVRGTRGMILITFREDETPTGSPLRSLLGDLATAPGSHRLHVPALSVAAVTQLAEGHAVEARRLHSVTGGNPFYVTEVLAAEGWTVPLTVTDAVLARAARLEPAARAVLEVVSVAPGGLEPDIAVALSAGGPADLDACLERGMLVMGTERVTFRHELARLAVEDSVPASRRLRLQRGILKQLERMGGVEPARLAHHADAAADGSAVLGYAPLAALEASRRGAHRAAATHLARAVDHAESAPPEELARLVSAWADERMKFDDPFDVVALRQRAIDLRRRAGDVRGEGYDLIELGRMWERVGADPAAYRVASQAVSAAIDILERIPPGPELAYAYACAGYEAFMGGRHEEAMRRADEALALAESTGAGTASIQALRVRGSVQMVRRELADGLGSYDRARRLAIEAGDHEMEAAVVVDVGVDLLTVRRYADAEAHLLEAIDLAAAIDLDYRVSIAELCLGWIAFDRGQWAEAERRVARVLGAQQGYLPTRVRALILQARVQVRRGAPDGVAALAQARATVEPSDLLAAWDAAAGQAEAAWVNGRPETIPSLVAKFHAEFAARRLDGLAGDVAFWLWRAGAPVAAVRDMPEPNALQMAGDWRAAAAAWDQIGCPYEKACALADGDEPAMREALEIFSRLGAVPAADRLRDSMRRAGLGRVPARPHRSNLAAPAQLTPRQLETLALIELGLTNGEIGARLFITEKTVGHHVSAILAKLGARSRTEAASTARKLGIVAPET